MDSVYLLPGRVDYVISYCSYYMDLHLSILGELSYTMITLWYTETNDTCQLLVVIRYNILTIQYSAAVSYVH